MSVIPSKGREWWPRLNDVSRATMTVYAAKVHNTGAAVVFPGCGYQFLAMDLEVEDLRLAELARYYMSIAEVPRAGFGSH